MLLSAGAALTVKGGIRMDETVRRKRKAVLESREQARRLEEERKNKILDLSRRNSKL